MPIPSPAVAWYVLVVGGMTVCALAGFGPESLPPQLVPARLLGEQLFGGRQGVKLVFCIANVLHALEACLARHIARRVDPANVRAWTFQTFLLGYPSLKLLRDKEMRAAKSS